MKLQENQWAHCSACNHQTEKIQEEKFGCDWCRTELTAKYPLEITVFYSGDKEAEEIHLCSWKCVAAVLPTIQTERFLTLPYVNFDNQTEGQTVKDLLALLGQKGVEG